MGGIYRRFRGHSGWILAGLLFFITGCATLIAPPGPSPTGDISYYHAYGDSITAGVGLPSPDDEYAVFISERYRLPLNNNARSGDQACDVSTKQIFPASDSPLLSPRGLYTMLISTNDVNVKGVGPYESVFNLCQQASIAWLALPGGFKVLANSSSVMTSGAGHLETANSWNAWTTDASGASITFPFQLGNVGPVYAWYRVIDGSTGSFTYSLDGKVAGSLSTATTPNIATQNGSDNSFALLRLPSIAAGAHTLVFTQTSAATNGMGIVAIGVPPATPQTELPRVLVGTTPKQLAGGSGACSLKDAPCLTYIADITANAALIAGDGLDVELFDSRKYMSGTGADMSDSLHPNATGHLEIYKSIRDILH